MSPLFREDTFFNATYRNSFFRSAFKCSSILFVKPCAPKVHYMG